MEIEYEDILNRFRDFFLSYPDVNNPKYKEEIDEMKVSEKRSLEVDCDDLLDYDPELYEALVERPVDVIPIAEDGLKSIIPEDDIFVRFYNVKSEEYEIRNLRAIHVNTFIQVVGVVGRSSEVKPELVEGVFQCQRCGHIQIVEQTKEFFKKPRICENPACGRKGPFKLLEDQSKFRDWQVLKIQERPEKLRGGRMPRRINLILRNDIVDKAKAGERVTITGILKTTQETSPRGKKTTFKKFIDVNYIGIEDQDVEDLEITKEEEEKIKQLSQDPFIIDKIANSIAPSIYGYSDIKEAIAMQLFSGVTKELPDGTRLRGDSNILLVGDPGVAKSQILQYASRVAPRSLYTSGKGTSAAGLTAAVVRDDTTGGWALEAGALVIADGGLACVDEIDKMSKDDRSSIHEAMEQQSYHPSFEITLSDGSKHKIGPLVDTLFDEHPEKRVEGIDCEILDAAGLDIELLTVDATGTSKIKADRVSRHNAPEAFVKIKYSNGRESIVTPEHPVYVFRDGKIVTEEASHLEKGEFVPAMRNIEFSGDCKLQTEVPLGRKSVEIPSQINQELASFLGYFATEGYSYAGSSTEVGLSNTDEKVISEMSDTICNSFGTEPINYTSVNRTIRLVSKSVYEFMNVNFPQLMKKSKRKRVPSQIFCANFEDRVSFLRSAFAGDGSTETEAVCYRTSSKGLAEDYQDLLLTLGIHSRILLDTSSRSYKVYITGCSLEKFAKTILGEVSEKVEHLLKRSNKNLRKHDVLPPHSGKIIRECLSKLGLPYDGYFYQHTTKNYGITREVIGRYIKVIEKRIEELENTHVDSFKEFRDFLKYSQEKTAKLIGITKSAVDYLERGGYSNEKRAMIFEKLKNDSKEVIQDVKEKLTRIRALEEFRWLRIKEVEHIPNEGKYRTDWVYDITMEPTHNFISHGILLHNTVSIAKAGIVATLNARSAILAASNPKYGRFDRYKSLAGQIDLPPTLVSRFDLVFVMTDTPDEERDKATAQHILDVHSDAEETIAPPIDIDLLEKYVLYAKKNVFPALTKKAERKIHKFYVSLRKIAEEKDAPVPITARQLEALIRLSEARARMRLSSRATTEDAEAVIKLFKNTLFKVGVDPETGKLDIDVIMTGKPKSQRDRMMRLMEIISSLDEGDGASLEAIIKEAEKDGMEEHLIKRYVEEFKQKGDLYEPSPDRYKVLR